MSNRRRSGYHNRYRHEFLSSPAWHARRDRWFAQQARRAAPRVCLACRRSATRHELELHHASYAGVIHRDGRWIAAERHADLIPLHPYCHELLHRLIDRDAVLAKHRDRDTATWHALERLHRKLARLGVADG
ncbi:hypothetical protein [Microbacterium aurum]